MNGQGASRLNSQEDPSSSREPRAEAPAPLAVASEGLRPKKAAVKNAGRNRARFEKVLGEEPREEIELVPEDQWAEAMKEYLDKFSIPVDLNIAELIDRSERFEPVPAIDIDDLLKKGPYAFDKYVTKHVILEGKPLVIKGLDRKLDLSLYTTDWLIENYGAKEESCKDLVKNNYVPYTVEDYLKSLASFQELWAKHQPGDTARPPRVYMKDVDCPVEWQEDLKRCVPSSVFYWNESVDEKDFTNVIHGSDNRELDPALKGIAPAGDLMSSLPLDMRADNIMIYAGHEGTYTPAHKEMNGSLGHNLMVFASRDKTVNYRGETKQISRKGSAVWFMTENKDRALVSAYFTTILQQDIETENYQASIEEWEKAPYTTYIIEQQVGDFILVPSLAPHQVYNRGTLSIKAAWNRTSVESLEYAIHEALKTARLVCREEVYKNKAMVYFTLKKYARLLQVVDETDDSSQPISQTSTDIRVQQLVKDFRRLFVLYTEIIISEMLPTATPNGKTIELVAFDGNVVCSFCHGNIFNRFLTCKRAACQKQDHDGNSYDVCLECYAMGRSCRCISQLDWVEQFTWDELAHNYEEWRGIILAQGIITDQSPQPLAEVRKRFLYNTLAEICQDQMEVRPWQDCRKPDRKDVFTEENPSPARRGGSARRTNRRRGENRQSLPRQLKGAANCHICKVPHFDYKLAKCSDDDCKVRYCYGVLWRSFEIYPNAVMEDPDWVCPKCEDCCSCNPCMSNGAKSHMPKETILGSYTKSIADPRSKECLVDFARSNKAWVKKYDDIKRPPGMDASYSYVAEKMLEKAAKEAKMLKDQEELFGDDYAFEDGETDTEMGQDEGDFYNGQDSNSDDETNARTATASSHEVEIPIDPALAGDSYESNGIYFDKTGDAPAGVKLFMNGEHTNGIHVEDDHFNSMMGTAEIHPMDEDVNSYPYSQAYPCYAEGMSAGPSSGFPSGAEETAIDGSVQDWDQFENNMASSDIGPDEDPHDHGMNLESEHHF